MTRFIMHMGISKTGTTTLQQAIFEHHSQINYLGKWKGNGISRNCFSEPVFQAFDPLFWNPDPIQCETISRSLILEHMDTEFSDERILLASWEGCGSYTPKNFESLIKRLCSVFDKPSVMFSLRNPIDWVLSHYLQALKGQYTKRNRDEEFLSRPYLPFETWAKHRVNALGGARNWFSAAENVRIATSLLGPECVGVFLFEQLKKEPTQYYRAIAQFLGINANEVISLSSGAHENMRLLKAELEYMRRVDSSVIQRWRWRSFDTETRQKHLRRAIENATSDKPVKQSLSEGWVELIEEATRESNRWVERECGLDLGQHGYAV